MFLQHGRMLRSARVTYPYSKEPYRVHTKRLAPNHCHLSPPATDDERASPKRQNKNTPKIPPKRTKKQLKSPTKSVKDVNDNTNKECVVNSPKTVRKKNKPCKKDDKTEKKKISEKLNKKDDVTKSKTKETHTNIEVQEVPNAEVKNANGNWTRDEDKTMLQVLKGEAASEEIFVKISKMLPHRSLTEIKERFCHVMNLLQQMAVGEVT